DQNYLVVRGRSGSLHGFHNTCRHRGSLLCEAVVGKRILQIVAHRTIQPINSTARKFLTQQLGVTASLS
ncbi:MAG TPA: hypothetical protein EYN10_08960, partial [Gammaproteobacteria bacterium]|nr:hypothetical protein [Gammaproteobacteria bacterium]